MKSTTRFWPCCRMSTPTPGLDRSTTTLPSPARPRRKSMSRNATPEAASARAGAKVVAAAAGGASPATGDSATSTVLPSIDVV